MQDDEKKFFIIGSNVMLRHTGDFCSIAGCSA